MKIILRWLIISASVWLTAQFFDGIIVSSVGVVFVVGACLTLFNFFIKPIINILTLPLNIITLGLFSLIINGLVFWFIGGFVDGFTIVSFISAFWGALIISIMNWLLSKVFHFD